jgi:bacteriocin resistance YdeI/OmpD-like protein/uncharacterized protein DUF1905
MGTNTTNPPPRATFRATIIQTGRNTTGIEVPEEVIGLLGTSRRPALRVSVNGHSYRSTAARMGGIFLISLSAENRAAAGLAGGDEVEVSLELDTAPREVTVPADLAGALEREPGAGRAFAALSFSRRQAYAVSVEGAKTDATRQRRIAKVVAELGGTE